MWSAMKKFDALNFEHVTVHTGLYPMYPRAKSNLNGIEIPRASR